MQTLDPIERLNAALGLPALSRRQVCHGYANCCACPSCTRRARRVSTPRQPWEARSGSREPVPRAVSVG